MILKKTEEHTVILHFECEVDDDEIIEEFESLENFKTLIDEESEDIEDFVFDLDWDEVDDDWFSSRKGGFPVWFSVKEEK